MNLFKRIIAQLTLGVFIATSASQVAAQTAISIPGIPGSPAGIALSNASTVGSSNIPSSLPPGMSAGDAKALMQQYGVTPQQAAAAAGKPGSVANLDSKRSVNVNEQSGNKAESSATMGDALSSLDKPENNPSEYQRFVAATVGEFLAPYGSRLFGAGSRFAAAEAVPTAGTYVIGPGDDIAIKTWGSVDLNLKLNVDKQGMINIPSVGPVRVAGLPFAALKQHLFEQLSTAYKGFELSVDIGGMKGIQVFVVGNARAPGSYTVNSAGTLMNALFASGGPSANGSMRKVQLKRGGSVVTEFDLYDFLVFGNTSKDVRLAQGDVIYIPPIGAQVAVAGSVKTPAIYELRGNETAVSELIKYAGGVTSTASRQNLTVERIDNRNTRQKIEIPLHSQATGHGKGSRYVSPATHGANTQIHDGDILVVGPLNRDLISIIGFVERPMRFGWHDGLRVKDLIPDRNYLTTPAFWKDRSQLTRDADLGNIRQPNSVAWNYAVVERLEPDLTSNLIPFNLGKAIDGDPEQNVLLRPGDVIRIFSKADLRVPAGNERQFVRLEGEFAHPGVYAVEPGETLRQLVARTGGLSRNSYLYGAEFTRVSVQQLQQKQLEEYAKNFELEIQRTSGQLNQMMGLQSSAGSAQADLAAAQAQITAATSLLAKIKNAKAQGRIVFEFDNASVNLADLPDVMLEDGDRFYVPRRPSTVGVYGAVFVPSNFFYKESSTVGDYMKLAGGYTRSSDNSYVYVLHADGTIRSASQNWILGLGGEPAYPGDAIVVPDLIVRGPTFTRTLMDWAQIFYQFGLAAAGITVLKNL